MEFSKLKKQVLKQFNFTKIYGTMIAEGYIDCTFKFEQLMDVVNEMLDSVISECEEQPTNIDFEVSKSFRNVVCSGGFSAAFYEESKYLRIYFILEDAVA